MDAWNGMSGGPVYHIVNGHPRVQAVYVADKVTFRQNFAILINDWLYCLIQNDL